MSNSEIVRSYLLCWGKQDMIEAKKLLSEDCTFSDPFVGYSIPTEKFLSATKAFVKTIRDIEIISILENDLHVGTYYSLTTDQFPKLYFSEWFKIENGKIKEGHLLYDTHPIRAAGSKDNQQ